MARASAGLAWPVPAPKPPNSGGAGSEPFLEILETLEQLLPETRPYPSGRRTPELESRPAKTASEAPSSATRRPPADRPASSAGDASHPTGEPAAVAPIVPPTARQLRVPGPSWLVHEPPAGPDSTVSETLHQTSARSRESCPVEPGRSPSSRILPGSAATANSPRKLVLHSDRRAEAGFQPQSSPDPHLGKPITIHPARTDPPPAAIPLQYASPAAAAHSVDLLSPGIPFKPPISERPLASDAGQPADRLPPAGAASLTSISSEPPAPGRGPGVTPAPPGLMDHPWPMDPPARPESCPRNQVAAFPAGAPVHTAPPTPKPDAPPDRPPAERPVWSAASSAEPRTASRAWPTETPPSAALSQDASGRDIPASHAVRPLSPQGPAIPVTGFRVIQTDEKQRLRETPVPSDEEPVAAAPVPTSSASFAADLAARISPGSGSAASSILSSLLPDLRMPGTGRENIPVTPAPAASAAARADNAISSTTVRRPRQLPGTGSAVDSAAEALREIPPDTVPGPAAARPPAAPAAASLHRDSVAALDPATAAPEGPRRSAAPAPPASRAPSPDSHRDSGFSSGRPVWTESDWHAAEADAGLERPESVLPPLAFRAVVTPLPQTAVSPGRETSATPEVPSLPSPESAVLVPPDNPVALFAPAPPANAASPAAAFPQPDPGLAGGDGPAGNLGDRKPQGPAAAAVPEDAMPRWSPVPPAPGNPPARSAEPAAEPPAPAVKQTPELPPKPAAQPVRDIRLELGAGPGRVEVRVADRGGEVKVAVHTPDTRLAGDLRDHLPSLSARLEQDGLRAETWHAAAAGGERMRAAETDPRADSQSAGDNPHSRQREQDAPPRRPRPDFETSPDGEKGSDFAWLMDALR